LLKILLDTSAPASTRLRATDIVIGHTAKAIFIRGRAAWIAGPCPFSQIAGDEFTKGGGVIGSTVRDWSDPVTYGLEGEIAGSAFRANVAERSFEVTVGAVQITLVL